MKKQTILIGSVSLQTGLALVPYTRFLNPKIEKAEKDTLLRFKDAWRATDVLLVSKCRLNLNTAVGSFIIRYMFGSDKTLPWLTEQWDALCITEGFGKSAYSLDNVLLLHTREFIKEIYEEEQRIKQEREEALRAAAEREQAMKARAEERQRFIESIPNQIESGKFQHPSIK